MVSNSKAVPRRLGVASLQKEAASFARSESKHPEPSLFGVTDGKAVGTYLQHKYLTVSNALQWRLQYSRVIEQAGKVQGVLRLA
jgi:hypothetical protein